MNEMSTPDFGINQSFSNDPPSIQSACFGAVKTVDKNMVVIYFGSEIRTKVGNEIFLFYWSK